MGPMVANQALVGAFWCVVVVAQRPRSPKLWMREHSSEQHFGPAQAGGGLKLDANRVSRSFWSKPGAP